MALGDIVGTPEPEAGTGSGGFVIGGLTLSLTGVGYYIHRRLYGRSDWQKINAWKASSTSVQTHEPFLPTKFEYFVREILANGDTNKTPVVSYDPIAGSAICTFGFYPERVVVGQTGKIPIFTLTSDGTKYGTTPGIVTGGLYNGDAFASVGAALIGDGSVPGVTPVFVSNAGNRLWGVA